MIKTLEQRREHAQKTIVAYVREHGPWNKKYTDTDERFGVWRNKNKKKRAEVQKSYYQFYKERYRIKREEIRNTMIDFLGGKCVRCSFDDRRALQVDHINGGGLKELRGHSHLWLYRKVIDSVLSGEKKYQLLCANCNQIKKHENNEVPHTLKVNRKCPYATH